MIGPGVWATAYAVVLLVVSIVLVQRNDFLSKRARRLEEYANDLDTYDRSVKVREIAVNAIIRSDERMKELRTTNQTAREQE